MLIRFKWHNCDLCDGDAFWLEATEQEAREQVFPLLSSENVAASEKDAHESGALAAMAGNPDHTFCFLVTADLKFIRPFKAGYPFHQLWNGYSPFEKIDSKEIMDLSEIARN